MANYISLKDLGFKPKSTWAKMWAEKHNQLVTDMERAFLFGNAWSEEEHAEMKAKGEPSFKINRIQPYIDNYTQIFKTSAGMQMTQPESHALLL